MSKRLVAYFSASGVTARVAKVVADIVEADLFEIKPEVPYTKDDLNWMNKQSRSSVEMADKSSRPAIAEKVENMDEYDIVFLGFPIWWYVAPTIINTFLESYDMSGKVLVLFATSGGSGFGKTVENLKESCKGAIMKEGKVLNGNIDEDEICSWLPEM
ncbi:MAG: NAD(P)H-dependent oxidoreductase [Lachnospiraceae bacterium]|nr:NAD(P)H-dependent oxidoreductase [Lachnospiraceae bacterium]